MTTTMLVTPTQFIETVNRANRTEVSEAERGGKPALRFRVRRNMTVSAFLISAGEDGKLTIEQE